MAKKAKKPDLDSEIERLYLKNAQGVSINVMDIGKLFNECRTAHAAGEDLEQAVIAAIKRYAA